MDEQEIPIDIHAGKLMDWLLTRRHCNKDYQTSLNLIREKITEAILSMPAHPKITQLLAGTQLNYFTCTQLLEVLKETESDTKNIFGYYSSKRMKDWQEINRIYEKDNVYLAEAALMLHRNVNFEVPNLRKQVSKHQSNSEDFMRKANEMVVKSNELRSKFQSMAERFGIKGEDIHSEFQHLIKELPKSLEEVVQEAPKLIEAIEYYREFLQFTQKRNFIECLPILNYLIKKGNSSFFEYKTGRPIEEKKSGERKSISKDDQIEIDEVEIEDNGSSGTSTGNGDFVHIEKEDFSDTGEINWDIEPVEGCIEIVSDNAAEGLIQSRSSENEYSTLLEHPLTRNSFINELHELEGFFDQRIHEMRQEEHILSSNQFQGAPSIIQMTSTEKLSFMLKQIQKTLNTITNERITPLFMMRDDSKCIDRTVSKMNSILEQAENCLNKSKIFEEKAKKEIKLAEKLKPEIPVYIKRTKDLQRLIEEEISKKYKGRPVKIMGGYQIL